MLMENIPYEFKELNIYENEDGLELNKINPINQIPVLIDGDKKIWDSRIIFNYLNLHHKLENIDWDDENNLSAIDGTLNAGVALILMKRSGININDSYMLVNRYKERIESVLDYFRPYVIQEGLTNWNFLTMSIYSFLDWGLYREVINLSGRKEYHEFLKAHSERAVVKATQIPKV
jgi:glutathione S-transferase